MAIRPVAWNFTFCFADYRPVWKFLKITAIVLSTLVVILAILAFGTFRAAKHVDPWYVEAVSAAQPEVQQQRAEAGDQFERQALDLRNEARRRGEWEAVFSEKQINGWLASDLKEKFPEMLPKNVSDPRVKFEKDNARAAFRLKTPQIDSVIIVAIDLYLTENENELAVRFRDARAGLVPLPLKRIIDVANQAADKTNIPLKWQQNDGDPVALIQIPQQVEEVDGDLIVETVEVRDGEVYLSGRTIKPDGSGGSTNVQRVIVGQLFRSETLQR